MDELPPAEAKSVGSFGGALDTERQVVFETAVGPTGFRAKATKKNAPSNW